MEGQPASARHSFCMGLYVAQRGRVEELGRAGRKAGRAGGAGGTRGFGLLSRVRRATATATAGGGSGGGERSGGDAGQPLAPPMLVNGRPVYRKYCGDAKKRAEANDLFLFFACGRARRWVVGPAASLRAGGGAGFWRALGDWPAPFQAGLVWQVGMGADAQWGAQPGVRVRRCRVGERAALVAAERLAQARALQRGWVVGDVVLEGLPRGAQHAGKMGLYEVSAGEVATGRSVYKQRGGSNWLFYADGEWVVGTRGSMREGVAKGWLSVTSGALSPDLVQETWQVWGTWPDLDQGALVQRWEDVTDVCCRAKEAACEEVHNGMV
eukprot:g2595.t1